jgi:aerobic-type carbon monoxide dehydrogenase small subunit (CoxS/CutS family)
MITLTVNDQQHQLDVDPATPLLYILRGELGLNGAKFGCGLGQCGACTVIVDGEAVFSCLAPVIALQGRKITTIEGLRTESNPNPLQRAFIEEQAAQCGYCIAGMIMRARCENRMLCSALVSVIGQARSWNAKMSLPRHRSDGRQVVAGDRPDGDAHRLRFDLAD